jgi:alpha-L-fucosidase
VKAKAFVDKGGQSSETVSADFDIAPIRWNVVSVTSSGLRTGSSRAIDANPHTFWHTGEDNEQPFPHQITVDLGEDIEIQGFFYTPIQHARSSNSGTIYQYSFLVSKDGRDWEKVIDQGTFANIKNNPIQQRVRFDRSYKVRYIQLVSHASVNDNEIASSAAEIGVITR